MTFNAQNTQLSAIRLVDRCRSGEGFKWDNIVVPVPIPAGATKLTVHVRSAKDPTTKLTTSADSLGWILAALSGPFAQDITFSGRATVARVAVLQNLLNVALGDTGNLPPSGGVLEETGVNVNIPPVILSGTGKAKTVGAGNMSNSEAKVEDLTGLSLLGVITASGEVLSANATASCSPNGVASASGNSTIANLILTVNGNPIVVPVNPGANTVLVNNLNLIVGVLRIVANEQVKPIGKPGDITVNALHITIRTPGSDTNDIVDVVIASAHADIACK